MVLCTLLTAFFPAAGLCLLRHRTLCIGGKVFLTTCFLPCFAAVCAAVLWLCYHPVVTCGEGVRDRLSEADVEECAALGKGPYSAHIPLCPARVEIGNAAPPAVGERITVYYLYGGTAIYSRCNDGYSCEKPLFPR